MNKIKEYCENNNISYEPVNYGGSYFKDESLNYHCAAIAVIFDSHTCEDVKALREQEKNFLHHIRKCKNLVIDTHHCGLCGNSIKTYHIFKMADKILLNDYELRKRDAIAAYWKAKEAQA